MVPNGWEDGRVGDLLIGLESGVSVNAEDRQMKTSEKGVLKVSAVSYGIFDQNAVKVIDSPNELHRAKTNPKQGQIIISRSNTEELVGASAYIEHDFSNLFLPDKLWQTIPKPNSDMKWLSYVLSSEHSRYTLSNLATGTSGSMKNITKGELLGLKIGIPPLQEQRKIAKILSTWDKTIATTEKLIETSKQQKKALMQQLLTGKKRLVNPETGLVFEGVWKTIKIKDVFKAKTTRAKEGNYTTYSVTKNGIVSQEDYFNKSVASQDTSNYKVIEFGDFVMSGLNFWMGSVDIYLNKTKGIISPAYKTFSVSDDVDLKFMYHFVRSEKFNQILVDSSIVGASVVRRNFNSDVFFNWGIDLPSMREQQKIASVLTAADKEIEVIQAKLAHFKQEKKALMQQLLTGKRRVKIS